MGYSKNAAQKRVSSLWTTPPPLGGISDNQPIAAMEPQYCLDLLNWYPGNRSLSARAGFKEWVTNFERPVKTIMNYYDAAGNLIVFAATDAGIYNITNSGDLPLLEIPVINGDFKSTIFGTAGKQYLVAVNSHGSPSYLYDGTSWIAMVEEPGTPDAPGEIKNVDPSTFSQVTAFKRRLWFVEDDSLTAWYLPIDSVGGDATPFYLGSIFKRGGRLLYIVDWSVDGGDGLDDKLVFVSDTGEMAVYTGDNPDTAETWNLQAVFYSATPLGDRTFVDFGGDVLFLTAYGVLALSKILLGAVEQLANEESLSVNINRALNTIANSGAYQRNWQIYNLQNAQALVVNIPPNGAAPAIQYVMNILTGAWTRYDMPINCAAISGGVLFFGTTDGRVFQYGEGVYQDYVKLDGTGGSAVVCDLFSAFSYMNSPTTLKHWKMMRLLFQANRPPNYVFKLNTDFALDILTDLPASPTEGITEQSKWDKAVWDYSQWEAVDTVYRPWLGVEAMGFSAALLLRVAVVARTQLSSLDFVYEEAAGFI